MADWFALKRGTFVRIGIGAGAAFAAGVAFVFLLPAILGLFAPKLDLSKDLYSVNRPVALTFVDADGDVVGHRGAIVGERLTLKQMPAYLPAAFIAMEDRNFYSNSGIDMKGLLRAAWLNTRAGHVVAGGSTITQQVAKIVFLTPDRTYARKFTEFLDAAALNKSLSKDQILELYLNRIYLGSGAYGVDGAAHVYFGKSARKLTLAEAAMLATLTRAPSAFSPRRDLAAAQARAGIVLRALADTGAIAEAEASLARAHPAAVTDRSIMDARNYYFDTAADIVNRLVAVNGTAPATDLIVHTVFEPKLQDAALKAVSRVLKRQGKARRASEAAVVVMKPDGAVAALLGGRDYDAGLNRATQAHRQPGSSFKPFVYLAAVEQGISPSDLRTDEAVDIGGWTPANYGGESYGTITVAEALAHSVNTITAELAQEVGLAAVVDAARRCGIVSPLEPNASLALGTSDVTPFELTSAYATFANKGMQAVPYFITEIDDTAGHVLYRRVPPKPKRIIADHVNRDMTDMLYGVVTQGTGGRAAVPGYEVAGKTGTTQDYHDAWFVGFSADYVTGVWLGNDDSTPMRAVTGGSLPAEIWQATMAAAEKGLAATPLDRSPPEAPGETGTIYTAGGPGAGSGGFVDDEAAPQHAQGQTGEHKNFWDWLFGSGDRSDSGRGDNGSDARDEPPVADPAPAPQSGREAPKYHWRSDPRWQNAPAGDPPSDPPSDPNAQPDRRQDGQDPHGGG